MQTQSAPLLMVMEYIFEKSGKRRKATKVTCATCQGLFLKRTSFVGVVNYCSEVCLKGKVKKEKQASCAYCKVDFYIKTCRLGNSKSGLYFCSRVCKDKGQRISSNIPEIHPPHYGSNKSNYREVAFRDSEKKCEACGFDKHPAAIIVHHKDRDRSNNTIDNLQVLCSNCHMIEHYESGDGSFAGNKTTR